ncbi:MAG: single-stranded-DNA-specific exonuclease RecJ [Lentisphaerae bacterium GWF2_49_21]|nr:MAG: single-stranded-DNA-specific exonuclease RecJ [Lentisphaerae bacterium GWF2_49_21]
MSKLNCSRPLALFFAARGINHSSADTFFETPLQGLGDPYIIPGMKESAKRLWDAICAKEKILIHGDYDTDGVTAAALLYWVLSENGADVSCFLPDRFDDGYGFTVESLAKALAESNYKLIVTVDCGITSLDTIALAKSKKVDVIVTDHHEPKETLPDAFTVINPKIHAHLQDLHILAGVGISFKLCHAFIKYGRENLFLDDKFDLKDGLDLVALGTVADIVPLTGENRILVRNGLKVLSKQVRPGIRALCEIAGLNADIKASDITYCLAPRLNAAGRLGNAKVAFDLLNTGNIIEAYRYAEQLEDFNRKRQSKEESIINEANMDLKNKMNLSECSSILVSGSDWHQGVIGIVASRFAKEHNRPAIVFSINGDVALGSGRSVEGINILDVLAKCSDLLDRFGGHPMAAGLCLKTSNLPEFNRRFELAVQEATGKKLSIPRLAIDGEIDLSDLNKDFFSVLEKLEPFGYCNAQPLFRINGLEPFKIAKAASYHSRGFLKDKRENILQFIAFNRNVESLPTQTLWDVVASPQLNKFRGDSIPQLQIMDLDPSEG